MLLYISSMTLATLSVVICFFTSILCFTYPRRSVFLFNVAFLLFSDGMSSFTFILWSLPKSSICTCTVFLPLQNYLFLHSFACTMLIARRFKHATTSDIASTPKEKWFWLYTFVWSFLFNLPVMLINYLDLHEYPDVSATFQDANIANFDFCYYSSSKWAFLFNVVCLILPCLLALSYNVYCFKSGLEANRAAASNLVMERETRTTRRYLGALVVVWMPTIVMNFARYFSWMSTYTFINIIVILTSMQGILHTVAYVMSYRPLRRYIKHTLCSPFCLSERHDKGLQDALVHHDDDEDEIVSPLAAYDIHTYVSPTRSSISGKSGHQFENIYDRTCSAENFVKFGEVQYQVIENNNDKYTSEYDPEEARDSFHSGTLVTPTKEKRGWKKLMHKLTPPHHFGRHNSPHKNDNNSIDSPRNSDSNSHNSSSSSHSSGFSPFRSTSRLSPQVRHEEEESILNDYYKHLFHQAH